MNFIVELVLLIVLLGMINNSWASVIIMPLYLITKLMTNYLQLKAMRGVLDDIKRNKKRRTNN